MPYTKKQLAKFHAAAEGKSADMSPAQAKKLLAHQHGKPAKAKRAARSTHTRKRR